MGKIEEAVEAWKPFVTSIDDWQALVQGIEPKPSGCGPIYEFKANPIENRPDEDFCIADMRRLQIAEPHYHPEGVTEIYFVIQGIGRVFVQNEARQVSQGSVVVIPPLAAHFTVPDNDLVLGVVNTPPFKPEDYIPLSESHTEVGFDAAVFESMKREVTVRGN